MGIVCQLQLSQRRNGDWICRRKHLTRRMRSSWSHVGIRMEFDGVDMNEKTLEVVISSDWIMLEWSMLLLKEMKAGLSIIHVIPIVKFVRSRLIMRISWFSLLAVIFMLVMKLHTTINSLMKRRRLCVCVVRRIAELEWIRRVKYICILMDVFVLIVNLIIRRLFHFNYQNNPK